MPRTSYNVSPNTSDSLSGLIPIGSIHMWATSIPPTDYLICDGSAISRTDYAQLYNVLGITYGSGNGTTTFNLPNTGGRTIRGTAGGFPLAAVAGFDTVQLAPDNLPVHSHTLTDPGHQHPAVFQGTGYSAADGGNGNRCNFPGTTSFAPTGIFLTPSVLDSNNNPVVGSQPIDITNPYLVLNFIIRVL